MSLDIWLFDPRSMDDDNHLFEFNVTHNLARMAVEVGVYEYTWDALDNDYRTAKDVRRGLHESMIELLSDPVRYKKLNPSNGWGNYEVLCEFVTKFYWACCENPDALIGVSR